MLSSSKIRLSWNEVSPIRMRWDQKENVLWRKISQSNLKDSQSGYSNERADLLNQEKPGIK